MSPAAGMLLVNQIVPIIEGTVPRTVKPVGSEDAGELVQDTIAMAAELVESCEARGKPLFPSSVAYYAIQHAKQGRRSYGATRTDALCPAAALDEHVSLSSMDEPITVEDEHDLTLHDLLAGPAEDPAQKAARELDWAELMADMNERDLALLETTIHGGRLDLLAKRFGVSQPRITQLKREIGKQIRLRWGEDALADVAREPFWTSHLRAVHERSACRFQRAQDAKSKRAGSGAGPPLSA